MLDRYRDANRKVCQSWLHACDENGDLHVGSRQHQPTAAGLVCVSHEFRIDWDQERHLRIQSFRKNPACELQWLDDRNMANQASVYHLPRVIRQLHLSSYHDRFLCAGVEVAYCGVSEKITRQVIDNTMTFSTAPETFI